MAGKRRVDTTASEGEKAFFAVPPSSRRHALDIFRSLMAEANEGELRALKVRVRDYHHSLVRASEAQELIAIDLAELLCARLEALLGIAHQLTPDARKQIVGAAHYFVSAVDERPDKQSPTGLDDDIEVFNTVVCAIGRPKMVITDT
jgi:uncharacterized membrane protein YkvA (DUF1232 family)